jgi:hypothetical protein
MEIIFEDKFMEEDELQEFASKMTPYPKGKGSWYSYSSVLSNSQGVIVPQLEPVVDQKLVNSILPLLE